MARYDMATYTKKQGMGQHLGGEYQYLMCAYYALKLSINPKVLDFRLTTNDAEYQVFDDIRLTVILENNVNITFLFQLKHGEPQRNLAIGDFVRQNLKNKSYLKNPFYLKKHIEFIEKIDDDSIIVILFTNNTTSFTDGLVLDLESHKIIVQNSPDFQFAELLVNKNSVELEYIFDLSSNTISNKFYVFSKQNNVHVLKQEIENELQKIFNSDIIGFFDFIKNWWAGNFVLNKTDMLAKLSELALAGFCEKLNSEKLNQKARELARTILNFDITLVDDSSLVTQIWDKSESDENIVALAALKFGFKTRPQMEDKPTVAECVELFWSLSQFQLDKILWHLNILPLILTVSVKNISVVMSVLNLWKTHYSRKKFIFVGEQPQIDGFFRVFKTLSDLQPENSYSFITNNFMVSLQGRSMTSLKALLLTNPQLVDVFGVHDLLEMTQKPLNLGIPIEIPNFYLPRTVSAIFLPTQTLIEKYVNSSNLIIINCEKKIDFNSDRVPTVELSDFFTNRECDEIHNLVILAPNGNCRLEEFERVTRISKKSVFLFQLYKNNCFLMLKSSNCVFEGKFSKRGEVEDAAILRHFGGHLNVISGLRGCGKSTLLHFLHRNTPGNFWSVFINVKKHKDIFEGKTSLEKCLPSLLGLEKPEIGEFCYTLPIYWFLDEVEDFGAIFEFVKKLSHMGFVWVAVGDESQIGGLSSLRLEALKEEYQFEFLKTQLLKQLLNSKVDELLKSLTLILRALDSRFFLENPLDLSAVAEYLCKVEFPTISSLFAEIIENKMRYTWGNFPEFEYLKARRLEDYEILALKKIKPEAFQNLKHHHFSDSLQIVESSTLQFQHELYADFFAATWFSKNIQDLPKDLYFSENHQKFRIIFDTIYFRDKPTFLNIIYGNFGAVDVRDKNQQHFSHLLCSYGTRYPKKLDEKVFREPQIYQNLLDDLDLEQFDQLFNLTCLDFAIFSQCLYPVEKILSEKKVSIDKFFEIFDLETLSYFVCKLGYFNILGLILEKGHKLDIKSLAYAAVLGCENEDYTQPRKGNVRVLEILLQFIKPQEVVVELLNLALKNNCSDMIEFLTNFSNTEKPAESILHWAVKYDTLTEDIIKITENYGVDLRRENFDGGQTLLHIAARKGNLDLIKTLLTRGLSVNDIDYEQKTPLHYAARSGHLEILKYLMDRGAEVTSIDSNKETAFDILEKFSDLDMRQQLESPMDWSQDETQSNLIMPGSSSGKKDSELAFKPRTQMVYSKRFGTVNYGLEYEILLLAYFSLKLTIDNEIIDYSISANDASFGYFDDIVISIKTPKLEETYALQVKHLTRKKIINKIQLSAPRGDFSLNKYFKNFRDFEKISNCNFVIFTNAKLGVGNNEQIYCENEIFVLSAKQQDDNFLKISKSGQVYLCEMQKNDLKSDESDLFNLYFYSNQIDLNELRQKFKTLLEQIDSTKIYHKYLKFIKTWSTREGKVERLNKKWVQKFLTINLLNPYIKPLEFGDFESDKMILFRQAVKKFSYTFLDEETYDFVKKIGGKLRVIDQKAIQKTAINFDLDLFDECDDLTMSIILWLLDECPLLVSNNGAVSKIIEFLETEKFLLFGAILSSLCFRDSVFRNLDDLKEIDFYKEILTKFCVSIQEKEIFSLGDLLQREPALAHFVSSSDLAIIMGGIYNIGGQMEVLPEGYIPRYLSLNSNLQCFEAENEIESKIKEHNTKITIIIDDPGTGKTQFLRSLKNSSEFFWIIFQEDEMINLSQQNNSDLFDSIITLKFSKSVIFEKQVIRLLMNQKRVVFAWDGLDEIPENFEKVTEIIKRLIVESPTQWISARCNLQNCLEEKFGVSARRFRPLVQTEQVQLLSHHFPQTDRNVFAHLSHKIEMFKFDFLAAPHQLELFVKSFSPENMSLLHAFNMLVERKFESYFQKLKSDLNNSSVVRMLEKSVIEHYEQIALKSLDLEYSIISDDDLTDVCGFLNHQKFVHSTFAEYFAAHFLSKKLTNLEKIFEKPFTNVRLFFDYFLGRKSQLHVALLEKEYDLVKNCEDVSSIKDSKGRSLLHLAASWGQSYPFLKVTQKDNTYFLDNYHNIQRQDENNSYLELLEILLKKCNFSELDDLFQWTPLKYAEMSKSIFAQILIRQHQKMHFWQPDETFINMLYYCSYFGHVKVFELCPDVPFLLTQTEENNLLHVAVCHCVFLEKLLNYPVYQNAINFGNKSGKTALHLAAQFGKVESLKILVEHGADINLMAKNGFSSLHLASKNGHFTCVKFLIFHGVNVNQVTAKGYTALHLASENLHLDCVKLLLECGANLNIGAENGYTPLHLAVSKNSPEIVQYLLQTGANPKAISSTNETPLKMAQRKGFDNIVTMLS